MVSAPVRLLAGPRGGLLGAVRPQVGVMSAQLVAGLGNLLFAVVIARVLEPGEYAGVVTFLALFVLLHVPSAALSAAGALSPERLELMTRRIGLAGVAAGAAIIAGSAALAAATGLDRPLIVVLGLAAPAAGLLGLARGVAYGHEQLGRVSASLVVEPAVRLAAGIALAMLIGPLGAAIGAVLSGYAALVVCASGSRPSPSRPRVAPVAARAWLPRSACRSCSSPSCSPSTCSSPTASSTITKLLASPCSRRSAGQRSSPRRRFHWCSYRPSGEAVSSPPRRPMP